MKSITIHNLDDSLAALLRKRARQQGTSLNETIKILLADALGIGSGKRSGHGQDFLDLCGIWSPEEVKEFEKTQGDFEEIHPKDRG